MIEDSKNGFLVGELLQNETNHAFYTLRIDSREKKLSYDNLTSLYLPKLC